MEELETIVQRMIDAGESEDNIKLVIEEYTKDVEKTNGSQTEDATAEPVDTASRSEDTSLDLQEDESFFEGVAKKFRKYTPSFALNPIQKIQKQAEDIQRQADEYERTTADDYVKDKDDYVKFLQNEFLTDDKYNYAALDLRNEVKDVRKELLDELGVGGFFGSDTRNQYMNLSDDDVRNIFNEQFDTKVLQKKAKLESQKIQEATQQVIDSGGSLDKEFSKQEDIDIMSLENPLERQLGKINQRLRVEGISDEEKNNLIKQQEEVVEKLKAPKKIINRQGQITKIASDNENFNFFYNPITGQGSNVETDDSQDLSKEVEAEITELSMTTQDKLENYYNNNVLENIGHKSRGDKTYDVTVGNKTFGRILRDAGYESDAGVVKNVPVSEMARFSHLFDDSPSMFIDKNNINISVNDPNKSDFETAQDFADYLRVHQEQGRDIAAKKHAIKQVYLLNKDVTSIKKKPVQRHFEAASEGIIGPRATESNFGYSNRKILDQIEEVTADADITLNDKQKEYLERSVGDEINEGFGGAYGILGTLLVANKVQGTVLGVTRLGRLMSTLNAPRYVKNGRVVTQAQMTNRAVKSGQKFDDVIAGYTKVGPSRLNQFNGLLLTGAMEEVKMQSVGFDPGVGAGFMLGAKALPFKWSTKYNQLNTLLNLSTKQAPAFVLGTNFGEITKGAIDDIAGEDVYSAFLQEHYGDLDKLGRKAIVDLALGAAFGATHLKSADVARTSSIAKLKNDAMFKMIEAHTKGDEATLAKYQEVYSAAKNRLDAMDKIDLYTNPATAQKAYQKQLDPIVKAFKAKGKDLVIETTTEELVDNRNAEYIPMQGGNPGRIRININRANPGLMPHEVSHAAFDLLFEGNPTLKAKYLNQLKNITKELKLEDGRSLYEAILTEKSIKDVNKVEEMFAYTTEFLSRAEHYTSLVQGNAFGKLKQNILSFSERNGLGKPALKTQQDLVNFLGRYVETIQKGYNPIKQLERLNEIVEVSEARKEGEKASFGSVDLKAKKDKIIEQNKKLVAEKPEGYLEQAKKNNEALKKINENLRISEANEKNIKIFKEREPGDPTRTRAENELLKDNAPTIETWFRNNFKRGLDVSEADFRGSMNEQVAKIFKSYKDLNVPFGYYLKSRLAPQLGNILRRAQAGRTTEIAMSEMGKDFDIETLVDVTPTMSAQGVGTHSAKGRRLVEDLKVPETTVNSIVEKVKELDVEKLTYKTLKDLAPEFTNELLGVEPKAGNISRGSVENAQKWFSNDANAKLFLDILPEGAVAMEGAPELVKGTATGVQNKLLEGFYKKSDRAKTKAGLPVQEKITSKDVQDVKEFFGIKGDGTFEYNRNLSAKVKGAVEQIGKAITNQVVREAAKNDVILGENIGKENLLNQIQAGKSEALASIDLLYKENKIKVDNIKISQDVGKFARDEAGFRKSNPKEHGIIKDFVELQTKYEAEIGRENEIKFTKETKKLPFEWAKNGSWQVSTAKFKKDAKLVEEFKDNAFDLADIIPLSENMTLGNAKMLVDLFTGHYSVIRGIKQYDKVNSPFKLGIRERLINGKESSLSQELQQRWKEFPWDKLKSSYASQFYTGLKKVYDQNTLELQKAEVRKFVNSENGKLQVELYDLWNSTLQEWTSTSKKGSKEYNNKMNFIARMKKHNSSIGTTGERVLAPDGYYYLPGKVVEGTLKYEHLKSSSEQSFESLSLIANGAWTTRGKESLKNYQGIWGMLKDFNRIDKQTGETNSAGIHRLAESLELAKNIWSVKSDFKRTLYQDIVAEVGKKEVNRIIESDKAITKQSVKKLKDIGLAFGKMSGTRASKSLKIHDKAIELGRSKNKQARGMSTFDFDETLVIGGKNSVTATKGKESIKITSEEFPLKGPELAKQGYNFDFSDFVNVKGGKEGPLMQKLRNQIEKYGTDNVFVLTARMQEAAPAIHAWLKSKGVELKLENITGLGNSTGEAKAMWMLEKFSEGYNDMYFVDDALPNVKAVKDVLSQLDIKSKVQQALASKNLNKEVNDILQHSLGIKSNKVFSKAEAKVRGKDIKRRRFFMPDTASDLELLLEPLYGKGKKGSENKRWFQENFIRKWERGINDFNNARQTITNDYMSLRKKNKDIVKQLPEAVEGTNFTLDQAIRIYIWNKNGYTIPDLTPTTQQKLVKYVLDNPKYQAYAESLAKLTKVEGGLKEPSAEWWAETIATEIKGLGEGIGRKKYIQDFIESKNEIFSEANLNKMESKLGGNWRETIEDMFDRMETGRTRSLKLSKTGTAIMNYLNGSTGAIMNFNTRSATLQLISTVNFVNSSFNNPLRAGQALANQPQYWKDFMTIMNSDMLKQRRQGLEINVSEAELASAASQSKSPAKAALAKILKAGYLPTKIADSFAIAAGGATYYRNAIKKYTKEGLSKAEAEKRAFIDFQAIAERTQQSSRADLLSKQQTSLEGRFILPFANTPMQMNRIMIKDILDISKGRYKGFYGENSLTSKLSRIGYYGFVQSAIFAGLQSGAFALMTNSDDDKKIAESKLNMLNTVADSFLRGMGIQGAVLNGVRLSVQEFIKQDGKKYNADYSEVAEKLLNISPTVGSKFSKLDAAGNTYDYNKKVIQEEGLTLNGPLLEASTQVIEATTNAPLNRYYKKGNNIQNAVDDSYYNWQRALSGMGWNVWGLGEGKDESRVRVKNKGKENEYTKYLTKEDLRREKVKKVAKEKEKKAKKAKQQQCTKIKSDGRRCKMMVNKPKTRCHYHD
tara:strand:- start:193 stop:8376 length:8184 start_codon:yes stop_codon:yes gene_type:complete